MAIISYAQNAEDVLIHRFFKGEGPQTYVDVGAAHPVFHSVTKHFYALGWRGLNLEPRPAFCQMLRDDRPEDTTLNCAVSDSKREMTFYEVTAPQVQSSDNGGLSTLDGTHIEAYRDQGFVVQENPVEVRPLSEVLEAENIDQIGFLKIDVEGHEGAVVDGMDWLKWRPRLVIIEGTEPLSSQKADSAAIDKIASHGYEPAFFDGLNQFLVRQEDADKVNSLAVPANVFDEYLVYEHLVEVDGLKHQVERHQESAARKIEQIEQLFEQLRAREERIVELETQLSQRSWFGRRAA